MKITMKVTGVDKIARGLGRARDTVEAHCLPALAAAAREGLNRARAHVKVDTGALRDSLELLPPRESHTPGRWIAGVGIADQVLYDRRPLDYWLFVHFAPDGVPFFSIAGQESAGVLEQRLRPVGAALQEDLER
jgi:hypothetical protein